jgi:sec-independent protein translocase protein TatA
MPRRPRREWCRADDEATVRLLAPDARFHHRLTSAAVEPSQQDPAGEYLDDEGTVVDDKYLIVILVLVILFGASRLPSLGRNIGQGIREFRKGVAESAQADDVEEAAPASPADDSCAAS